MNYKTVKRLIALVEKSAINELEVEEDNLKVRIKKAAPVMNYTTEFSAMQPVAPVLVQTQEKTASVVTASANSKTTETAQPEVDPNLKEVVSPMVGTFYRSPGQGKPTYVEIGDTVQKGDILCIIEAMKLMNEIEAPFEGKVASILADNAQPVEFGEKLFMIK